MTIIVSQRGKFAKRVERSIIQQEDYLQQYIYANPDALPLHEIKSDLRLLIVAREFPTASGPIDALGIDGDGEIYLIETKLYKNPDKRLVLAQVLDYGASLWHTYTDPYEFIARLEKSAQTGLGKGLSAAIEDFFGVPTERSDELFHSLKQNLAGGSFRFIVLMDRLDERLKHLISFVNANSNFDLYGVELDFYEHEGFEIIIPSFYGAEQKKEFRATSARQRWDEDRFFTDAQERLATAEVAALRRVYDWTVSNADEVSWGVGKKTGSFSAKFLKANPRSIFAILSSGHLTFNFKWLVEADPSGTIPIDLGQALLDAGFSVPKDFTMKWPSLAVKEWEARAPELLQILNEVLLAGDSAS